MLIVLLSECKRGFIALQQWLYWSAKVAVWQCKVACFEPSFVVHHACQCRNMTLTDFTLHFSCCFTNLLHSHFVPLLNNFTMQEKCY